MKKIKFKGTKLNHILSNNLFLIKLALTVSPMMIGYIIISQIVHQIIVFFEHTYMIAYIIDSIQFGRPFRNVATFIILMFIIIVIYCALVLFAYSKYRPVIEEKIAKKIRFMLFKKAAEIDISAYDDPEFYTNYVWVMSDAPQRVNLILTTTSEFLGAITVFIITGLYIGFKNSIALLFVVVAAVLSVYAGNKFTKFKFELDSKMKPLQRRRDYINRIFYLSEYAKEIRLSNIKQKLVTDYKIATNELYNTVDKGSRKIVWFAFLRDFVFNEFIINGLYIFYLMFLTIVKKLFSYGTMVALYRSAEWMKRSVQRMSTLIPQFQEHSLYIDKIKTFLEYENKLVDTNEPQPISTATGELTFKDVNFSYREGQDLIKDINLTIKPGEKIALVGYNGAGKTTLIKLLMRLYDVTSGEILYNGINIKDYSVKQYRRIFGTIFQDYQLFAATLMENITMDHDEKDTQKALKSIELSEFADKFRQLAAGFDTILTKEFDDSGVNFSGGEAQKVALARALYKSYNIIVLDEPSSALDPMTEYKLNKTILDMSNDKTVIYISHRLSTTKIADKIYMLEHGRIIESGNHNELMQLNGKYAEMFLLQAKKYR